MKQLSPVLVLASFLLIAGGFSLMADEPAPHHESIHFSLDSDDLVLELDDLEIGETRQFFTEEGKEVLVTRTEEGLDLEVDGKKMNLGLHRHDGQVDLDFGSGERRVKIHTVHSEHHGEGEQSIFVVGGGEEGESEHSFAFVTGTSAARERLEATGVLDDLDEETRQRILDALEEGEAHEIHMRSKVIVIDSSEDDEGE